MINRNSEYYWEYDLVAKHAFIDTDNVSSLIEARGLRLGGVFFVAPVVPPKADP